MGFVSTDLMFGISTRWSISLLYGREGFKGELYTLAEELEHVNRLCYKLFIVMVPVYAAFVLVWLDLIGKIRRRWEC